MTGRSFMRAARRMFFATAASAVAGMLAVPALTTLPAEAQGPASVADLAERLVGAVVNISTSQNLSEDGPDTVPMPRLPEGSPFQDFFDEFFNDRPGDRLPHQVQSLGSGFIIDADEGIVVTNNHVIADADEIVVNFPDGSKLDAELVGVDPKTDLAVLKIDPTKKKLSEVKFGDSESIRIGDWVMAIGNPFGLGGSVTIGIVSARNREIGSGPYDDYIQTDAAINRGNSGGPLFNMDGEVIGINTAIISPTGGSIGIGFAIPSTLALNVIEQLRKYGETRRGWLGVRIQEVTSEIAESLGMDEARGALVSGIIKGGPADEGGSIQPGDVIVEFDGKPVDDVNELPRIVAESPVGKVVDVVVMRKGEKRTVRVKLGRLEEAEQASKPKASEQSEKESGPVAKAGVMGMTVSELGDEERKKYGIADDVSGVVVTEVAEDSAAADKGIAAGDVIVEIAQESVSTPQDVLDRISELRKQGRKNALLMLASKNGELRFVTVRMD